MSEEAIQFGEIPEALMKGLHEYSVTLFGMPLKGDPVHRGTGTLVKSGNAHFILTAGHCAEKLVEHDAIGLPIRFGGCPFIIPRLDPIYIGEKKSDEWVPDLAFLPIHHVDVDRINANTGKTFYNLERYKDEILREEPKMDNSLWAVVGTPILLSRMNNPKELELHLMAYKVKVESPITNEEFDSIDIRVALDGKHALPTFQGVSGGGLWHAELHRNAVGSVVLAGPHRLVGCAFYETEAQGEFRYIRCHGWRSIYEKGLAKLRTQESVAFDRL